MRRRSGSEGPGGGEQDGPDTDPIWVARIREGVTGWYESAGRKLPWRLDRDPYRILVSEMMLVQTTVAAVIPYFDRFLRAFPDVGALAKADEAEVLKAWEGLGYYRRARQLQAAARAVVDRHGGAFPDDRDSVLALPGVGKYIAGALLSFAFDRPEPIVEANTQRVLTRWLALRGDVRSPAVQSRLWKAAARLVPPEGSGAFNQAFMELGALVCTPRAPRCLVCPVSTECRARAQGLQDDLPESRPKAPPIAVVEAAALVRRGEEFLLVRRGPGGLWEDFWEFPTVHVSGANPAGRPTAGEEAAGFAEGVRRLTGLSVEIGPAFQTVRYTVTKHRVRLDAHHASPSPEAGKVVRAAGPETPGVGWFSLEGLGALTMSAAGRRIVALLRESPEQA